MFYAAKSVRKGSKVKTINIIRIGKLSELALKHPDPVAYCRVYVRKLTDRLEEVSGLNISSRGISNTNCTKLIRQSNKRD